MKNNKSVTDKILAEFEKNPCAAPKELTVTITDREADHILKLLKMYDSDFTKDFMRNAFLRGAQEQCKMNQIPFLAKELNAAFTNWWRWLVT